jgi:hypothetical protein
MLRTFFAFFICFVSSFLRGYVAAQHSFVQWNGFSQIFFWFLSAKIRSIRVIRVPLTKAVVTDIAFRAIQPCQTPLRQKGFFKPIPLAYANTRGKELVNSTSPSQKGESHELADIEKTVS